MMKLLLIFMMYFLVILNAQCAQGQSLIPFVENERWGFKNEKNEVVVKNVFFHALAFSDHGIAAVVDDSGWIYINTKGEKTVRPFVIDNGPDYFSEGLARFIRNGRIGFINKKGSVTISATFSFVRSFSENLAAFCEGCKEIKNGEYTSIKGGKWGFINGAGEVAIHPQFDKAGNFIKGRAEVVTGNEIYFIDKEGKKIE